MKLLCSHFAGVEEGPIGIRQLRTIFPDAGIEFLAGKLERLRLFLSKRNTLTSIEKVERAPVLKVFFPAGRFGPLPGTQWKVVFKSVETVFLKYKLFIPPDFDFVKGGKLPGLGGGTGNTGGKVPSGSDGWSVRFMFKEQGEMCAYLYYPAMPDGFGEKLFLKSGGSRFLLPKGKWLKIGLEVQMNETAKENGFIRCFIDDELMLERRGLQFRSTDKLKIDHLLFSTFFGGADFSYAPPKDCFLLYKDFIVEDI
ncbi:polysaccharide lyase [Marinilabilia sp.]|uniref:polysaccharide lyase n=1 Tax=Marinilabilia sp. TaxID=2021252 RepID=UPI0025BB607F|nr:hypothetical protein [Marinilabilia sp.]